MSLIPGLVFAHFINEGRAGGGAGIVSKFDKYSMVQMKMIIVYIKWSSNLKHMINWHTRHICECYIKICNNIFKTQLWRQVQKQRNHIYALAFTATAGEKMILHIFSFLHIFYIYFYISGELTLSDISLMTSGIRSNVLELWDQQLHLENKNQCIWQLKTKIWQSVTTLSQILTNSFA